MPFQKQPVLQKKLSIGYVDRKNIWLLESINEKRD